MVTQSPQSYVVQVWCLAFLNLVFLDLFPNCSWTVDGLLCNWLGKSVKLWCCFLGEASEQTVVAAISQLPVTRSWHDPLKIHRALLKTISKPNGIASTLMYKSIYDWHWLTIRFKRPNGVISAPGLASLGGPMLAGSSWWPAGTGIFCLSKHKALSE